MLGSHRRWEIAIERVNLMYPEDKKQTYKEIKDLEIITDSMEDIEQFLVEYYFHEMSEPV